MHASTNNVFIPRHGRDHVEHPAVCSSGLLTFDCSMGGINSESSNQSVTHWGSAPIISYCTLRYLEAFLSLTEEAMWPTFTQMN